MEDSPRMDIRKLLKSFGIQADESIFAHLTRNPGLPALKLRVTLTDLTDYGDSPPDTPLHVEIEGSVRPFDAT